MSRSIVMARDGDKLAKSTLVDQLRPRISRMASYYSRCTGEDADDLLQEAWCGLLESLPNVDIEIGSPEQFLIQRARWKMLDSIKRAKIRRCVPIDPEDAQFVRPCHSDQIVGETTVLEFTGKLKSTQKQILFCLMRGMTWRETGDALGFTSANVAYHVKQIRREYEAWSD